MFVWQPQRGFRSMPSLYDPCTPEIYSRFTGNPAGISNNHQIAMYASGTGEAILLTPYIPGDLDEDMDVQLDDLTALLSHFGLSQGAVYSDGDLDCDGDVSLQDLTIVLSNYGETFP